VDLVALVRSHGVELKKRGRSYVGLCPFHEESKPSFTVNPSTNLYHCFGCPKGDNGGNAITFLMKKQRLGFRDAYDALVAKAPKTSRPAPAAATAKPDPKASARRQKLLSRVVAYYRRCFNEKPMGREYLARRGITDTTALEVYEVGLCDGSLLSIAPDDPAVTADLKVLGILSESGRELFDGCVVFPLLDESHVAVGMYGRRLTDGEVNHLYLPGPRRGLVNRAGAQGRLVLCEAILDALTLSGHDIPALPCYGTQGFTADHRVALSRSAVEEVLICFDGDEPGRTGAEAVFGQLKTAGIKCRVIDLPDGTDINSLVVEDGIERMRVLLGLAPQPAPTQQKLETVSATPMTPATPLETTPQGFILRKAGRTYEVKGVSRQGTQLRVTLKASRPDDLF
jgi:DNA primase catalytic core